MNILIDGMGGDNAPLEIVKGAVKAADKIDGKITIIGREEEIIKAFEKIGYTKGKIEIVNATEVVTNNEAPAMAVRRKGFQHYPGDVDGKERRGRCLPFSRKHRCTSFGRPV